MDNRVGVLILLKRLASTADLEYQYFRFGTPGRRRSGHSGRKAPPRIRAFLDFMVPRLAAIILEGGA